MREKKRGAWGAFISHIPCEKELIFFLILCLFKKNGFLKKEKRKGEREREREGFKKI